MHKAGNRAGNGKELKSLLNPKQYRIMCRPEPYRLSWTEHTVAHLHLLIETESTFNRHYFGNCMTWRYLLCRRKHHVQRETCKRIWCTGMIITKGVILEGCPSSRVTSYKIPISWKATYKCLASWLKEMLVVSSSMFFISRHKTLINIHYSRIETWTMTNVQAGDELPPSCGILLIWSGSNPISPVVVLVYSVSYFIVCRFTICWKCRFPPHVDDIVYLFKEFCKLHTTILS